MACVCTGRKWSTCICIWKVASILPIKKMIYCREKVFSSTQKRNKNSLFMNMVLQLGEWGNKIVWKSSFLLLNTAQKILIVNFHLNRPLFSRFHVRVSGTINMRETSMLISFKVRSNFTSLASTEKFFLNLWLIFRVFHLFNP